MGGDNTWTVGRIARHHKADLHRVEYVVKARGIQPCGWAGHARLFDDAAVELIGSELRRIEREREEVARG